MLSFGVQNINHTSFVISKLPDMFLVTLFVVCLLLNVLLLLFFAVWLVITSAEPVLLHFNLEKHHSYFAFSLWATVDLFYCLFWSFQTLNTYTLPLLFVGRVQKDHCYLSVNTSTCKNISRTLFVVYLALIMFFVPFSNTLTWTQ